MDRTTGWTLLIDGTQQSHVDTADPMRLEFEYVRRIANVLDLQPLGPLRAVHLGGGGLTLPRYISATRPGSVNLVVERDSRLVEMVREHLPWPGAYRIRVRIGDARAALDGLPPAAAEVVISDVFDDARTPGPMTSLESFASARRALSSGGLMIANIADQAPLGFTRRFAAGVLATFADVVLIAEPNTLRGRRFGNLVLAAGSNKIDVDALARRCHGDPWPARVVAGHDLRDFVAGAQPFVDHDAPGSPQPPPGVFG